jgi:hypothetical protein
MSVSQLELTQSIPRAECGEDSDMYLESPATQRIGVAGDGAGSELPNTICATVNQTLAANRVRRINRYYCK